MMALKVEAKGGKGGKEWDDGFNYEGVTKIHVRGGVSERRETNVEGTKFSLRVSGKKIIGFCGFAEKNLNSLGAYFIRMPPTKSAMQCGQTTGMGMMMGMTTMV
ncbi:unnamed protein product [Eruca vesicaria subsp. sativa]|uniref:Jacalin-type lectin domain-containing protein n=1 Tax=Eruca vesicaria subsp. sativa TaxID=29727 RepID=A0ABC8JM69_ERUVS|nr:unnamed protein product [Eruca vesicaria subsp. sativa]